MSTMINSSAGCPAARPTKPSLFARLIKARDLSRQRAALRDLDDRALDDLGLTRSQAEAEARRPVWDAPSSWLK